MKKNTAEREVAPRRTVSGMAVLACRLLALACTLTVGGGLDAQDTIELDTPDFTLRLTRASQTVAALEPKAAPGFDFG